MRFLKWCVVLLAGLLTACAAATGGNPPAPPDDITIQEVHTKYEWYGWGSRGYTLDVTCEGESCTAASTCSASLSAEEGDVVTNAPVEVPAATVNALRVILAGAQPVDEPQEVIEHTDDYPNSQITLITSEGESLLVTSTSNSANNIPWNLQRDGQWYVHNNEAFPTAYGALLESVNATECWGF